MRLMPTTRRGAAWRALLALVVIVGCAAGATATAGLLEIKNIANGFKIGGTVVIGHTQAIKLPAPGKPETLLLVGVDCRPHECSGGQGGNTDTMMLVRIDDSSSTVNLLSIPRDLAVQIPGYGLDKLNAAYADGGADGGTKLLLQTLRADVFPKLVVNHVMLIDFSGFAKLINEIGCVYTQVDRRYYNHSIGPADPTTNYSSIDIQPGYQKLCGGSGSNLGGANTALAFVRFRHNDSDFVRQARQQDFLRWAKQNYSTDQLAANASTLFDTFSHNVQTDHSLHTVVGIDDLIRLAINANGATLKSIPYPDSGTEVVNGEDDVILNQADAEHAYSELMTPTRKATGTSTTVTTPTVPKTTPTKGKHRGKKHAYVPPADADMVADVADGTSQAAHLDNPGLPVYYPKYIPNDFGYCFSIESNCNVDYEPDSAYAASYPRRYVIDGNDGKKYASYVMTLVYTSGGEFDTSTGEFASVQGTTWPGAGHAAGPPLLRVPTAIKVVGGKVLYEYSQGGALTVVAWKTSKAVYWISNDLQNNIPNNQMVAMAASLTQAQ